MRARGFVSVLVSALWVGQSAFGWGSYGHEQINWAAAQSIATTEPGKWLMKNEDTVTRLAVTPDYDWKKVGKPPEDDTLESLRRSADHFEHPLHYFEPDAFILQRNVSQQTVDGLPVGNYWDVYEQLKRMLSLNSQHVIPLKTLYLKENEELPDFTSLTPKDVTSFGTAPWRAAQLWRLGVEMLKKGDFKGALMYLGAMGHYVGDSAQPFHGDLDHDGKNHANLVGPDGEEKGSAEGIHAAYETGILKQKAEKEGKATWDPDEKMWDNLDVTNAYVVKQAKQILAEAQARRHAPRTEAEVERAILNLIVKVHPYVDPLEDAFAEAMAEENGEHATVTQPTLRAFSKKRITVSGVTKEVFRAAEDQMAQGAALLAELWLGAFEVAQADMRKAPKKVIEFDPELVLREYEYPKPDYLPQLHGATARATALAAPERIFAPSCRGRCHGRVTDPNEQD